MITANNYKIIYDVQDCRFPLKNQFYDLIPRYLDYAPE